MAYHKVDPKMLFFINTHFGASKCRNHKIEMMQ